MIAAQLTFLRKHWRLAGMGMLASPTLRGIVADNLSPDMAHSLSIVFLTSVDPIVHGSPCEVLDGNSSTQDPL